MNESGQTDLQAATAEIWADRSKVPQRTISRARELIHDHASEFTSSELTYLFASQAVAHAMLNQIEDAVKAADSAELHAKLMPRTDLAVDFELRRIWGRSALFAAREIEALKHVLKNLEVAAKTEDEHLLGLAHSDAASVYGASGNLRKALEHLQQSLQRTPEESNSRYGTLLNNLGNVYLLLGRQEEALACFIKARQAYVNAENDLQIAITYSNEARALDALGHYDRAITIQTEALERFAAGGFGQYVSASHYKLADTLVKSGKITEAEKHYLRAIEIAEQPGNATFEDDARAAYGKFLLDQNRPAEAVEQYARAVEIMREGSTFGHLSEFLEKLIVAQEAAGYTDAALDTIKQLVALRDQMGQEPARTSNQTQITELEQSLERELELVRATASALVEANKKLSEQSKELADLATTDHLTGLRNRRHFTQKLEAALWGHRKSDTDFSVVFLDVDGFKRVNDSFGHETGDLVLQELARILESSVRETDVVARWGGEEFAVLLAGANAEAAGAIAEKLNSNVAGFDWNRIAPDLAVTVSAGVICSSHHVGATADDIMRTADQLLYGAKLTGRNRVMNATAAHATGDAA